MFIFTGDFKLQGKATSLVTGNFIHDSFFLDHIIQIFFWLGVWYPTKKIEQWVITLQLEK